jgi:UDP-N-acetyl-D-glucosamine dehydrogenase
MDAVPDMMQAVAEADCVVIITNHRDYDYDAILEKAAVIVDTRNALGSKGLNHPKVVRL